MWLELALAWAAPTAVVYAPAPPTTLDPLFPWSTADRALHALVHDRLVHPGRDGWWSRLVANVEQDGTRATVTLQRGLSWHDGHPVDAGDVCFTVAALAHPGTQGPYAAPGRARLASCVVGADALTAEITAWTDHDVREALAVPLLAQHVYGALPLTGDPRPQAQPVGCGAYRATLTSAGWSLSAVHPGKVPFPQLLIAGVGDPRAAARVLAAGTGLATLVAPPPTFRDLRDASDVHLYPWDRQVVWSLALDTTRPPFDDPDVRWAFDLLVDREALRDLLSGGAPAEGDHPWPLVTGPWLADSAKTSRGIDPLPPDPERAAALLAGAGYRHDPDRGWLLGDEPLTVQIAVPEGRGFDPLAVGPALGLHGVRVQVEAVGPSGWWSTVLAGGSAGHHHAALLPRELFPTEDPSPWFHTRGDHAGWFNVFAFSDPEVDRLLSLADEGSGRQLHGLLADLRPHLFLFEERAATAWRARFTPFMTAPFDGFSRIDAWRTGRP